MSQRFVKALSVVLAWKTSTTLKCLIRSSATSSRRWQPRNFRRQEQPAAEQEVLPAANCCCLLFLAMRRPERVADILREEISQIVGYELKDPRVTAVTVTD